MLLLILKNHLITDIIYLSVLIGDFSMKIGFTTTSVRQIKDIKKIVDIARDAGADCIEWGGDVHVTDVETARYAKKLCYDAGIKTLIYGSYYRVGDNNRNEWIRICEIASALGASSVRVWLGRVGSEATDKSCYNRIVEDSRSMCSVASDYGLSVCSECHGHTFNDNTDAFLKIRSDVDCVNFKTYFQSLYKKTDYDIDRIKRTASFIESVHISYFEQFREQFPKHNGKYIDTVISELRNCGFDGNILIEFTWLSYHYGIPSMLKKDIARLRNSLE